MRLEDSEIQRVAILYLKIQMLDFLLSYVLKDAMYIVLTTIPISKFMYFFVKYEFSASNFTPGKKIQEATGEKLSTFYLMQRISIAIQKGNAVCVRGCPKKDSPRLEGLFNFHVQEADML